MVRYIVNLGGTELPEIDVPKRIKGIRSVAEYITREYARKYARGITPKKPLLTYLTRKRANEDNWYDSHIDVITDLLEDLRIKLVRRR